MCMSWVHLILGKQSPHSMHIEYILRCVLCYVYCVYTEGIVSTLLRAHVVRSSNMKIYMISLVVVVMVSTSGLKSWVDGMQADMVSGMNAHMAQIEGVK